jgi:membrane protein DedA with SNARE-associated domain
MIFNLLGAALWVSVISGAGYLFGQHWERLAMGVKRIDMLAAILLVLVAAFLWWKSRQKNNRGVSGE